MNGSHGHLAPRSVEGVQKKDGDHVQKMGPVLEITLRMKTAILKIVVSKGSIRENI